MGIKVLFANLFCLALMGSQALYAETAPSHAPTKKQHNRKPNKTNAQQKTYKTIGAHKAFSQGLKLYQAGKYQEAAQIFTMNIKRFPEHTISRIHLAKSYYRLERFREAFSVFAGLNPQSLDDETSYEYGWTFYVNKQWPGALYGFQRVQNGHALSDLANYYGGVCAIKLRQYPVALEMLEKAVVLPDKLTKSRRIYLKHVQSLILIKEKQALAKERKAERRKLRQPPDSSEQQIEDTDIPVDKLIRHRIKPGFGKSGHSGFSDITKNANTFVEWTHQLADKHGTQEISSDERTVGLAIDSGYMFPIPIKQKDDQGIAGIQLKILAQEQQRKGTIRKFILEDKNKNITRIQNEDIDKTNTKLGSVNATLWVETPMPNETWFMLGGEILFNYPELERADRDGLRSGFAQLAGRIEGYSLISRLTYTEILDNETLPIVDTVDAKLALIKEVFTDTIVSTSLNYKTLNYMVKDQKIEGPDATTALSAEIYQQLPLNFALILNGNYEIHKNYIHHDVGSFNSLASDGKAMNGALSLTANPFSLLAFSLTQTFAKMDWSLENTEAQKEFEENVDSYLEETSFKGSINILF